MQTTLRLLKLNRYYDGASLLMKAITDALRQLLVPLFMLLIMIFTFASLTFEIEWDGDIERCLSLWDSQGIVSMRLSQGLS